MRRVRRDPLGKTTTYSFDTQYRVMEIIDAYDKKVSQYWNSENNLTRVQDLRNSSATNTYFDYDARGNVFRTPAV